MIKTIGFIGLGTVGRHMAANMCKGNYEVTVFDKRQENIKEVEERGGKGAQTPLDAASDKDMVIVVLPEQEEMRAALASDEGFLNGLKPGTVLVDMGMHSLDTTLELASEAQRRRISFLDAPVWGTREHAAHGLLTILVGGDNSVVSRVREAFSYMSLNTIHVGEIGDATRMMHVVTLVQAQLMEALAEGLVLGRNMGFDINQILEVLDAGGVAAPLLQKKGRAIAHGNFKRNLALKYVQEGLNHVQEMADKMGLELPATEAVRRVYAQAVQDGRGEEDYSAVIKVLHK